MDHKDEAEEVGIDDDDEPIITHGGLNQLSVQNGKSRYDCGFCGEELIDEKTMNFHAFMHLTMVPFETSEGVRTRREWLSWRTAIFRRIPIIIEQRIYLVTINKKNTKKFWCLV